MLVSIMFTEFLGNSQNRQKLHQGHHCVFFLSSCSSSETLNYLVNLGFQYNLAPSSTVPDRCLPICVLFVIVTNEIRQRFIHMRCVLSLYTVLFRLLEADVFCPGKRGIIIIARIDATS